jgi:hypothetical protein
LKFALGSEIRLRRIELKVDATRKSVSTLKVLVSARFNLYAVLNS